MVVVLQKKPSHSWWFQGHSSPKRSPWLQSTLSELDEKTTAMLKVIEEDADSFAQRAEMYYKKRPELINMVEDFYRTHRSLAERFDQLKSEPKTRLITPLASPLSSKYQSNKLTYVPEKSYDSYSDDAFGSEMSGESEVDDPEEEEETQVHKVMGDLEGDEVSEESEVDDPEEEEEVTQVEKGMGSKGEEVSSGGVNESEVMKLREEIERLKEENKIQKEQLIEKDEEKREVIRQLTLSMEIMRENLNLSRSSVKESDKKWNHFEFNKLKGLFSGKLFNGSSKSKTNLVAL
ncbi:KIP1-like [Macleaya cordata]|uniref:KIP1-like n=1 Tax=Macleaya cordata TaxID=56857 RepID=A0A200QXE4_MACCD|nr:KIP1-like [Macleaya cordata]